ncbi:hypothetical protein Gpo141_00009973 [Globisporangium polare]
MMNLQFHKPMSADYARHVVTRANRTATANQSATTKPAVDLLDSASTVTVESSTSVTSEVTHAEANAPAKDHAKKTWWRQHVISQSMVAMLKAPSGRC